MHHRLCCLAHCLWWCGSEWCIWCRIPEATIGHHAFYKDTGRLRIDVSNMMNMNTNDSLIKLRDTVLEILSKMQPPTGVPISAQPAAAKLEDAPEADPDVRGGGPVLDELRVQPKDGYDSDEETTERVSEKEPPSRIEAAAPAVPMAAAENGRGPAGGPALLDGGVKAEVGVAPAAPAPLAEWAPRAPEAGAEAAPAAAAGGAAAEPPAAGPVAEQAGAPQVTGGGVSGAASPMVGVVAPMPLQDQTQLFKGPTAVHSVPVGQAPVAEVAGAQTGAGISIAPDASAWPPA